ncbi:MAG: hypothetical protein JWR32_6106 [Mycobacterium sp.]|jgi:hypothetical protein|nr:hypothetical protein [Mycobacterium sp.]
MGRMFFQILGAIPAFERALMSERTLDGLAAAERRSRERVLAAESNSTPLRFALIDDLAGEAALLCPGLDFVDRVVFERREVLDDKG